MSALGFAAGHPVAWLPVLMILGIVANGLRLRARAKALPVVPVAGLPDQAGEAGDQPVEWLVATGVSVEEPVRAAVRTYARQHRLEVVDLVPADLPADAALNLLRQVDPATYTTERLAAGRGAGQAMAAGADLLRRAEIKPGVAIDPAALLNDARELKKYAPATMGLVTVPGLRAGNPGGRRARSHALGIQVPLSLVGPALGYAALVAGTVANPGWGVAALAAFSLQPYLVFGGTALRPRDLHRAALLRLIWDPAQWLMAAFGPVGVVAEEDRARKQARIDQARPGYAADIAAGVERFFEPRRTDCPWCGSADLARVLSTPDLHQSKPGTFVLDGCGSCGHVFQNPRLSLEGLDFYYRDFYDGAGANQLEGAFGAQTKTYRDRAETMRPFTKAPRSWLDVGTGHGHFCTVARDAWPQARFDGLDMTDGIEDAARRGWVDQGFRGMFPEMAGQLAGGYDVVSMSHYLEHTREPKEELDAAVTVLRPGGHLMIEVPDPEWPLSRVLKRYWFPWLQAQHQHLVPIGNLKQALEARGLSVVGENRDLGRLKFELTTAAYLFLHRFTKDPDVPWAARRPGVARRALRVVALAVAMPVALLTVVADLVISIPLSRTRRAAAYRVVARKPAEAAGRP